MEGILAKIQEHAVYVEEIRRRIYIVVVFFLVVFVVGFFSTVPLFRLSRGLVDKYLPIHNILIVTTSPFQFVDLAVSTGIFIALLLTLPLIFFQVFSFLSTGLTAKEKKKIVFYIPLAFILFFFGFAYGFATLYYAFDAVAKINLSLGIQNFWDISQFLSQVVITSALLGILFQFPLLLTLLIRVGLLDVRFLKSKRRHAVAAIFVITSLLPPTDGVSLIVMTVPLIAMYEGTILFNVWTGYSKYVVIN